ncbi:hypothetical protein QKW35_19730 [Pontibacterium granulatum]|uniref:hypothetical protein n=1 Tax=Pontibacterium granulatum TaxID=2036029 RepID=UPI00249C4CC5|nr:hypothetical protein [Pontibacterium granulatum]MDI3326614.1 hypothetical protein [Pontibacterium granulatum]
MLLRLADLAEVPVAQDPTDLEAAKDRVSLVEVVVFQGQAQQVAVRPVVEVQAFLVVAVM